MIIIQLTQNKTAFIDDSDSELAEYSWQYDQHTGYAKRKFTVDGKRVTKYLHRMIFEKHNSVTLLSDELVDHENNNRLDCRTCNLRLATPTQNACNKASVGNKTGYKGVTQKGFRFYATVYYENVAYRLGSFSTPELASLAYIAKALEVQKEFAYVN